MIDRTSIRPMLLALAAMLFEAVVAFAGAPESGSSSGATDKPGSKRGTPSAKAQSNLGLDLGKLRGRIKGANVPDMFPGAQNPNQARAPASADSGARAKGKAPVRPPVPRKPAPMPFSTEVVVADSVAPPGGMVQPVVPPPPPPVQLPAVPAPFKYAGTQRLSSGRTVYFLTKENRIYAVEAGQAIDSSYTFEGQEGDQLIVTYLPLHQKQTITTNTGSPS